MKADLFKVALVLLHLTALLAFLVLLGIGLKYYNLPLSSRPYSELHRALKPSGAWGHGLGMVGASMLLLLFLYTARKRMVFGLRRGSLSQWLNVHIFFGLAGPLFITLHSTFKFNGIVSVSYFSMMAVMLSGIFGRYIYMQIPRDARGTVLSLDDIRRRDEEIAAKLSGVHGLPHDVLARVQDLSRVSVHAHESGLRAIAMAIFNDVTLPYRLRRLKTYVRLRGKELPPRAVLEIVRLAREKAVLERRIALLNSMRHVFHLWHVLHRPFAIVMLTVMFVHITVVIVFGYRWIF